MTCLASLLNDANAGRRPVLDAQAYHGTLCLLGYRLIHFSRLGGLRPTSHLENVVHLGLVSFMMPLMHRLDGTIPTSELLYRLIRSAMQKDFGMDEETQEIVLWTLLVAGASVFTQPKDEWLLSMISQTMHSLRLRSCEEVTRTMNRYPWIDVIHGKACRDLCGCRHLSDRYSAVAGVRDTIATPEITVCPLSIALDT